MTRSQASKGRDGGIHGFKHWRQCGTYPADMDTAPERACVYGIFTATGSCLYVGQALDIRARLKEHAKVTTEEAACVYRHDPRRLLWEHRADYLETSTDRERALIREYSPPCNRT